MCPHISTFTFNPLIYYHNSQKKSKKKIQNIGFFQIATTKYSGTPSYQGFVPFSEFRVRFLPILWFNQKPKCIPLQVGVERAILFYSCFHRKPVQEIAMQFRYETERLVLMVSRPSFAEMVAGYLLRNREDFEKTGTQGADKIYTPDYQRFALEQEEDLFLRHEGVRYYIFHKEKPGIVIGNVSFAYINYPSRPCSIGYRMDKSFRRNGYAYEAASFLLPLIVHDFSLKGILAEILPENTASLALIKKLGFTFEGINKNAHEIMGVKRDHYKFMYYPNEQQASLPDCGHEAP